MAPFSSAGTIEVGESFMLTRTVFTDPLIDNNASSQYREINAKVQKTRHTDKSSVIVS